MVCSQKAFNSKGQSVSQLINNIRLIIFLKDKKWQTNAHSAININNIELRLKCFKMKTIKVTKQQNR